MTIVIDGTTGISGVDGTASNPSYEGTDSNTGIFYPAADTVAIGTGGSERMRVDTSGNVGIGTSSPAAKLSVSGTATFGTGTWPTASIGLSDSRAGVLSSNENGIFLVCNTSGTVAANNGGEVRFGATATTSTANATQCAVGGYKENATSGNFAGYLAFKTSDSSGTIAERARITSAGEFLVAKTAGSSAAGFKADVNNTYIAANGQPPLFVNRNTNDGVLVQFRQDDGDEGNISVSGSTVSYNGGHLSRYAQTQAAKDESILKGTVLSNLDEMNIYVRPTTYWTDEDELPEGASVGDIKEETYVAFNEQLNKVKVSDVEGDANVAGVFVNWSYDERHQVDEINMAMTGDMIIRIAQGVTVQKGDLLMSAGDGTAKPQGDDIVRSKTIAKVTSNHVTCTYEDGSYCVPCVLMAC